MLKWLGTWKGIAAAVATALGLLSSGVTMAFRIDARYAHATEVEKGINTLQKSQFRQERRYLRDKIRELELRADKLSVEAKQRLKELQDDLKDVEEQIKDLK